MQEIYWAEQPAVLPGRYRTRTAVGHGCVLQVSGRDPGRGHVLKLLRVTPWGTVRTMFSYRFRTDGPVTEEQARDAAVRLLYGMTRNDPAPDAPRLRSLAGYPSIARDAAGLYARLAASGDNETEKAQEMTHDADFRP